MIEIETHDQGAILPIRTKANARKNEIRGQQNGRLKVAVTAAPEKGKANKAILNLLAAKLNVRRSQLEITGGETSVNKRVLIRGIDMPELTYCLEKLL